MNWDVLLIQNDPKFSLILTYLDDKSEVVSCQALEYLEDHGQSKCHIGMPTFDHYIGNNESYLFFFQVQYDLSTTISPPPESFKLYSYL